MLRRIFHNLLTTVQDIITTLEKDRIWSPFLSDLQNQVKVTESNNLNYLTI